MIVKIAAACEQGNSHVLQELPCQDYAAGYRGPEISAAVLCDGAGSCPHAEDSARAAAEWALSYVPEHFEELYSGVLKEEVKKALVLSGQEALGGLGRPMEECYCTILFYAVHQDGRWICGHIGDGVIFQVDGEGARVLSHPENGLYKNETYFLSQPCAWEHLRLGSGQLAGDTTTLLTSDGCGDALYVWESRTPAKIVSSMCGWLESYDASEVEMALHENLRECFSKRSDDDLSIVLMHCSE